MQGDAQPGSAVRTTHGLARRRTAGTAGGPPCDPPSSPSPHCRWFWLHTAPVVELSHYAYRSLAPRRVPRHPYAVTAQVLTARGVSWVVIPLLTPWVLHPGRVLQSISYMLVPTPPSLGLMAGTASAAPVQKRREKRQNSMPVGNAWGRGCSLAQVFRRHLIPYRPLSCMTRRRNSWQYLTHCVILAAALG